MCFAKVVAEVNGPTLQALSEAAGHDDPSCVEFFRKGAPLLGKLPMSSNGDPFAWPAHECPKKLEANLHASNKKLVSKLRADSTSEQLFQQAVADAGLGRMSPPVEAGGLQQQALCAILRVSLHLQAKRT